MSKLQHDLENHGAFAVINVMRKHPELKSISPEHRTLLFSAGAVAGYEMAQLPDDDMAKRTQLKQFMGDLQAMIDRGDV